MVRSRCAAKADWPLGQFVRTLVFHGSQSHLRKSAFICGCSYLPLRVANARSDSSLPRERSCRATDRFLVLLSRLRAEAALFVHCLDRVSDLFPRSPREQRLGSHVPKYRARALVGNHYYCLTYPLTLMRRRTVGINCRIEAGTHRTAETGNFHRSAPVHRSAGGTAIALDSTSISMKISSRVLPESAISCSRRTSLDSGRPAK
jgi:hypothetical protein